MGETPHITSFWLIFLSTIAVVIIQIFISSSLVIIPLLFLSKSITLEHQIGIISFSLIAAAPFLLFILPTCVLFSFYKPFNKVNTAFIGFLGGSLFQVKSCLDHQFDPKFDLLVCIKNLAICGATGIISAFLFVYVWRVLSIDANNIDKVEIKEQ